MHVENLCVYIYIYAYTIYRYSHRHNYRKKKGSVETGDHVMETMLIMFEKMRRIFFYNCFFSIIQSEGRQELPYFP